MNLNFNPTPSPKFDFFSKLSPTPLRASKFVFFPKFESYPAPSLQVRFFFEV